MAIDIGGYNFDGPHPGTGSINAQSGVYVILGRSNGAQWNVIDVGESESVRERIEGHDRKACWQRRGYSELSAAVLYVGAQQRMTIERDLRASYNPPCGER